MLPLDEPTFDIDANTRDILVPEVFRKNGVGVQGDQLAETLFFTIDRYFDTTDLYSDDIKGIIQWESAPKGKQFETGYSPIVFKDVTIVKNKMVFGWLLNDTITANPGTVKFSVRFFSATKDTNESNKDLLKLDFSLSTKTQTITINPAISYDINNETGLPEVNEYNDLHLVTNRFKDSVYVGEADSAEAPVFVDEEFGGIFNFQAIKSIPVEENGVVVDKIHYSDLEEGKLTLLTQAVSTDAGKISYFWKEKDLNSKNAFDVNSNKIYIETEDIEVQADKDYYVKVIANGSEAYNKVTDLEVGQLIPKDPEGILYYELFNGLEVNSTGDYWVEAKNRHGVATTSIKSEIVRVPGPGTLEVESPAETGNFLDEDGKITLEVSASTDQEGDDIHYSWIDTDTNSIIGNENSWSLEPVAEEELPYFDKEVKVSVYAERNGDETDLIERSMRITAEPQIPFVMVENNFIKTSMVAAVRLKAIVDLNKDGRPIISDDITYKWFKQTYDETDNDIELEGGNKAEYIIAGGEQADSGVFYCEVTNHVNGGSISVDSEEINVIRN